MTDTKRTELISRDDILNLLSNEETAKVSTSEGGSTLSQGDEYVDLLHLDKGVLTANAGSPPEVGHALARRDVRPETWTKILAHIQR